jgi:hypothetical protein
LKKRKQIHLQIWFEEGKSNLEGLLLSHLQKREGGKHQFKTKGMVTTLMGSKKVLAI